MHASYLHEFRRGTPALAGSMIGAGCGLSSISFYTHSVFAAAIVADSDWSRGDVQLGVTIMILMAIFTAPAVGALIDRFGARRVALTSVPLYGVTLAALSLATDAVWTYYLAWAVMSVLAAGTLPVTWTRVVTAWFDRYRGIALGITLAGTGVAATFAPPYVTWLIAQYGWRGAYLALGVTTVVIALPAVFVLFREPKDHSESEVSARAHTAPPVVTGITPREALRGYRLWVIGVALVLAAAGISGLVTNLVPLLIDRGLSAAEAARYAGLIGISVIAGRLVVGALVDRFWAPLIAAIFLCAPALSALSLAAADPSSLVIAMSVIVVGLAAGAEVDLMAFLASRYFGLRHYGTIYGALYVFFSIGAGLAPVTFGRVFDHFGSYGPILTIVACMSIVGGLLMLTLGSYPAAFARAQAGSPE